MLHCGGESTYIFPQIKPPVLQSHIKTHRQLHEGGLLSCSLLSPEQCMFNKYLSEREKEGKGGREGDMFCQIHSIERGTRTFVVAPCNSLSPSISQSIFDHKTKRYL